VKVQNWIIENAPEDVVCVLDDDIDHFYYRLEDSVTITKEEATMELERMCQIQYDLGIGLLGSPIVNTPWGYSAPFKFSGMIGPIRIYNRAVVKARYIQMDFFSDTDFALQELLLNRIVLRPDYLVTDAKLETNKGGMNIRRTKRVQEEAAEALRQKWGRHFNFNTRKNVTMILVER
jgi:hypothetical protein